MTDAKCDIIIPVYKAPEWVKLCLYAIFVNNNSSIINKVYLINDCNDSYTTNCLKNLKNKYGDKLILKQNKENLGFIKTVNTGLSLSTADYVLLLNSDCLLAKNTIQKLMNHLKDNPKIGLICPLASNAANISIPMPEGWNYTQIDSLLEKHFLGKNFNACTVVGNCLMITRKCLNEVGKLDESYGTGYGEETDYQFKAMEKGFQAKVAIDTYVFHKSEASFGTSKEKQEKLKKNRELFFSRWELQYNAELEKYSKNDPIKYIESHLPKNAWKPHIDTAFYLDGIFQNAGGVHAIVDIVNYLTINGESINIIYNIKETYREAILFNPISAKSIPNTKINQIVSTVWKTVFDAYDITNKRNINLLSFVQGYEAYFENGTKFGAVELSYKIPNGLFTVSHYLHNELKETFGQDSYIIPNSINLDLIYNEQQKRNKIPTITIIMRDNVMKGDWLLMDFIKKLDLLSTKFKINLVSAKPNIILPLNLNNVTIDLIKKPQDRNTIYQLLQKSDYYVDASLSEGFGFTALEAMAAGCIPIISNSMGVKEYLINKKNGIIISDVNNVYSYIEAISSLLHNQNLKNTIIKEGLATAKAYNIDNHIDLYRNYFKHPTLRQSPILTKQEKSLLNPIKEKEKIIIKQPSISGKIIKKIVPKPIRVIGIKIVSKLFKYINENA